MEVFPGIHQLRDTLDPGTYVAPCLFKGEFWLLADTGVSDFPTRMLAPYLKEHRIAPRDVQLIFLSHCHWDHAGGSHSAQRLTGAPLMAHPCDVAYVEHPRTFLHENSVRFPDRFPLQNLTPEQIAARYGEPVTIARYVADGEVIGLGNRKLRVLHAPGHTYGHCALFEEASGVLWSSDAVQGFGAAGQAGTGIAYYRDRGAYLHTVGRLAALKPRVLITAHQFKPFADSVLMGEQVNQFFAACLAAVNKLDQVLLELLFSGGARTLTTITAAVLSRISDIQPWQALMPVLSHLEHLQHEGRVTTRTADDGQTLWLRA